MDYRTRVDDEAEAIAARISTDTKGEVTIITGVEILDSGVVVVDGVPLPDHLTKREAQLLKAVLRRKGTCTKEHILQELYGGVDEPELKIIDVFACKTRKKLGEHAGMIETVWGRGYGRNPAYHLLEPSSHIQIDLDLRHRLDELAIAMGRRSDELGAELLLAAVRAAEKATWE